MQIYVPQLPWTRSQSGHILAGSFAQFLQGYHQGDGCGYVSPLGLGVLFQDHPDCWQNCYLGLYNQGPCLFASHWLGLLSAPRGCLQFLFFFFAVPFEAAPSGSSKHGCLLSSRPRKAYPSDSNPSPTPSWL